MGDYERAFRISAVALAICSRLSNGRSTRFRLILVACLSFVWAQVPARATLHRPACQGLVISRAPREARQYVTDPDYRGQVDRSPV